MFLLKPDGKSTYCFPFIIVWKKKFSFFEIKSKRNNIICAATFPTRIRSWEKSNVWAFCLNVLPGILKIGPFGKSK